jgi:hypothetical protein
MKPPAPVTKIRFIDCSQSPVLYPFAGYQDAEATQGAKVGLPARPRLDGTAVGLLEVGKSDGR